MNTPELVTRLAALKGGERVLLLAPGPHGSLLLPGLTAASGPRTVLLDSSPERLAKSTGCQRVQGRATRFPFRRHSFDTVVSVEALFAIRPPWTVVAEIHRVLKPDGRLVLIEPASQGVFSRLRDRFTGPGKRVFETAEVRRRFTRADFEIASLEENLSLQEFPRPVYALLAKKLEIPAEPAPRLQTAREMIEARKKRLEAEKKGETEA